MTRYEKIKEMSVEELAKYLQDLTEGYGCRFPLNKCPRDGCSVCWHEWLTQGVVDG